MQQKRAPLPSVRDRILYIRENLKQLEKLGTPYHGQPLGICLRKLAEFSNRLGLCVMDLQEIQRQKKYNKVEKTFTEEIKKGLLLLSFNVQTVASSIRLYVPNSANTAQQIAKIGREIFAYLMKTPADGRKLGVYVERTRWEIDDNLWWRIGFDWLGIIQSELSAAGIFMSQRKDAFFIDPQIDYSDDPDATPGQISRRGAKGQQIRLMSVEVLSANEVAVFDLLNDEPQLGKDIAAALARQGVSTIGVKEISAICKRPSMYLRGVRNRPRCGYFISTASEDDTNTVGP